MEIPDPPVLTPLSRITPSIYEATLSCLAKAAWSAAKGRIALPEHPAAILGTCFHFVVARAHQGALASDTGGAQTLARHIFDEKARELYEAAHPLLRVKFPSVERLPYFNMYRERAALLAAGISPKNTSGQGSGAAAFSGGDGPARTEAYLTSRDGLIAGRPDHLDLRDQLVVDYKSGYSSMGKGPLVSEAEARQLRLYAYLGRENGSIISKGEIVRSDGERCPIVISEDEARQEAAKALAQLQAVNAAIRSGGKFHELASPSSSNCKICPCIPFCEPFWNSVSPQWENECGTHVEGEVSDAARTQIQGVNQTTLKLQVRRRTVSDPEASVEQIPSNWLSLQGATPPDSGDVVRLVYGRRVGADGPPLVIRSDRTITAIWRVPSPTAGLGVTSTTTPAS